MPMSKSCAIVAFAVSTSISRTHDRTWLSPVGVQPTSNESHRRVSAPIASFTRVSAVARVGLDPRWGARGGIAGGPVPEFLLVASTTTRGTPADAEKGQEA